MIVLQSVPIALLVYTILVVHSPCHAHNHGTLRAGRDRRLNDPADTMEWSYDFVEKLAVGFKMTLIVKDDYLDKDKINYYNTKVFQSFRVFGDLLDDKSVVAKENNVCYLAIRGQEKHVLFDVWQTVSPFVQPNAFGSGCDVKRSFLNAYNACFAGAMLQALDDCYNSCPDGACPVVLHGHSTGGSALTIAALDPRIKKYNPIIIAVAPLRGIVSEDCQDENLVNVYRIVAVNAGIYDGASTGRLHRGYHYGRFFMLDETSQPYYIAPADNADREPEDMAFHGLELYYKRMQAMAARPATDFPLQLSKFPNGHWCNYADECQSQLCSEAKVCASEGQDFSTLQRLVGAHCTIDADCSTGICRYEACALPGGKMAEGSPCQGHADCVSGTGCSNGLCVSLFFNGSFCQQDDQCVSQSCSGQLSIIAQSRRCADP